MAHLVSGGLQARVRRALVVVLTTMVILAGASLPFLPGASASSHPVGLGTADAFAVLAGQSISNTGPSVVNGNLGVSPGTAVTGFGGAPNGTVNGVSHAADATSPPPTTTPPVGPRPPPSPARISAGGGP
jgi:hypothetical protein